MGWVLRLLFLYLLARLLIKSVRWIMRSSRGRQSRPVTRKPKQDRKKVLGKDIVDAEFEDLPDEKVSEDVGESR